MHMGAGKIDEKLKNENCTVEDLLDEEEIIQEMKNQNAKLINYFDKEKVRKLVDYIILEPLEDDQNKGHKYPFTAAEILSCDVIQVMELFWKIGEDSGRKSSSLSNQEGGDIVLSQDDHVKAFSNETAPVAMSGEGHIEQTEEGKDKEREIENVKVEDSQPAEHEHEHEHVDTVPVPVEGPLNDTPPILSKPNAFELLDYLLQFLNSDKELNYVLAGYFSKCLTQLINKFPSKIIPYLYIQRKAILEKLIFHSEKKSIAELTSKILMVENLLSGDKEKADEATVSCDQLKSMENLNLFPIRDMLIEKLFQQMNLFEKNPETVSNLASICVEILEVPRILKQITSNRGILRQFFSMLSTNMNSLPEGANYDEINMNYIELLNVGVDMVRLAQKEPCTLPTYKSSQNENEDLVNSQSITDINEQCLSNTVLGELVLSNLDAILQNFLFGNPVESNRTLPGTYGISYRPLGMRRIILVEFVLTLLSYYKNVSSILDNVLIKSNFLKASLEFFFEYEWNNMFQQSFLNLMKFFFNDITNHPEVAKYLFDDLSLHQQVMTRISQSSSFVFNSNHKINHGFFAVLVELCYKINTVGGGQPLIVSPKRTGSICFANIGSNNFLPAEITAERTAASPRNKKIATSTFIKSFLAQEWEDFFKDVIFYWVKLFETKLCSQEQQHLDSLIGDEPVKPEEKQVEENMVETSDNKEMNSNPFASSRDANFFEEEDWMKKKEDNPQIGIEFSDNPLEGFEFPDETMKISPKSSPRKSSDEHK